MQTSDRGENYCVGSCQKRHAVASILPQKQKQSTIPMDVSGLGVFSSVITMSIMKT